MSIFKTHIGFLPVLLIAIASMSDSQAVVRDWPGTGPCAGGFQACVDAGNPGDTIRITTTAPVISGAIEIDQGITITSAPGARGLFRNGNLTLSATGPGNRTIRLSRLKFETTQIRVVLGSTLPDDRHQIELSELDVSGNLGFGSFSVSNIAVASERRITIRNSVIAGDRILAVDSNLPDDGLVLILSGNRIRFTGTNSEGLTWSGMGAGSRFEVTANRVEGQGGSHATAVFARASTTPGQTGTALLTAERNVIVDLGTGFRIASGTVSIEARVGNNSTSGLQRAVELTPVPPGILTARVTNNVFARGDLSVFVVGPLDPPNTVFRSRNLYHDVDAPFPGGFETNAVLADPMVFGAGDLRLTQASPAIDQADGAEIPTLGYDHDGIHRARGPEFDIGAFEWEDGRSFAWSATASNISGNVAILPTGMVSPGFDDFGIVQRRIDGNGAGLPVQSTTNFGIYSSGIDFRLFTESMSPFPSSEWFVLRPGSGTHRRDVGFVHRAVSEPGNPGNNIVLNTTRIPNTEFSGSLGPIAAVIPIVLQRWDPPGSNGQYNDRAVGIYFEEGGWHVFNQDLADMPNGAGFHVVVPSIFVDYAFKVHATTPVGAIALDHHHLNDNSCAHAYVTAAYGDPSNPSIGAAYVPAPILVRFDQTTNGGGNWVAVRGDGLPFSPGTVLHVYVDPEQSRSCGEERPFSDGFE